MSLGTARLAAYDVKQVLPPLGEKPRLPLRLAPPKLLRDAQRKELLKSRLLAGYGTWQREGAVKNLIAKRLEDLTPLLGRLATESRDFK